MVGVYWPKWHAVSGAILFPSSLVVFFSRSLVGYGRCSFWVPHKVGRNPLVTTVGFGIFPQTFY